MERRPEPLSSTERRRARDMHAKIDLLTGGIRPGIRV